MTTDRIPTAAPDSLTDDQLRSRPRAANSSSGVLMPAGGSRPSRRWDGCPTRRSPRSSAQAITLGLHGGRVPVELGGQGWSMLEWFLVNEQFGR